MESAPVNTPVKDLQTKGMPVKDVTGKVDVVVQEYMDSLLGDLFPSIDEPVQAIEPTVESLSLHTEILESNVSTAELIKSEAINTESIKPEPIETKPVGAGALEIRNTEAINPDIAVQSASLLMETTVPDASAKIDPIVSTMSTRKKIDVQSSIKSQEPESIAAPIQLKAEINKAPPRSTDQVQQQETRNVNTAVVADTHTEVKQAPEPEPEIEKRFPAAPNWAQQAFDVLLFDVCGLKLAVPMESLGRIIKVAHETNQLIGRPDWFIGAYNEADEHLYVVDTAKYIMPEKGYDLERDGFAFLIQLQKSKWTLACKSVHTTVRVEPDQVKWRSSQGKRQWLSGTVIEHMCALIHVDHLIDLLEANS